MPTRPTNLSWLPEHQLHVPLTLAHADASIQRLGEILFDYLLPGPLELGNVPDGDLCHVTVTRVAPLPAAVPRYAADVLHNLKLRWSTRSTLRWKRS